MERKTPLTRADIDVAARLVQWRKSLFYTRRQVAAITGIKKGVIIRLELPRMPLRYRDAIVLLKYLTGASAIRMTPINPLWLAYGDEPRYLKWPLILPAPDEIGLPQNVAFLGFVDSHLELLKGLVRDNPKAELPEPWLSRYYSEWCSLTWDAEQFTAAAETVESVFVRSARRLAATSGEAEKLLKNYEYGQAKAAKKKNLLTDVSVSGNYESMKPLYPRFLERLRRATRKRGMKSALASHLEVPLVSVSQWLSGEREAGGETTLKLLRWVQRQEQKLKQP